MFLKRLDVIGFKSFAERISVDFVKASRPLSVRTALERATLPKPIRWVLGEQSARSLRGGKWKISFLREVIRASG
ncbi:hypothetical protein QNN00_19965 [Bacillus velezensis]|nr:hypothetical protein [Bacillus velezensis]